MKLPKRIRLTAPALQSRAAVEETLREIANITLRRNRIITEIDERITAIKAENELVLTESQKYIEEKTDLVRAWAEANPSEFGKTKSLDLTHAVIGWRTGNPALKTLSGWTWDRVLEKIQDTARFFAYIRRKLEVDKAALIADRESFTSEDLRAIGVKITQDEAFYVEPKLTEIENTIKS